MPARRKADREALLQPVNLPAAFHGRNPTRAGNAVEVAVETVKEGIEKQAAKKVEFAHFRFREWFMALQWLAELDAAIVYLAVR